MRVFVSEYTVGGASSLGGTSPSMRSEGLAMLRAVMSDIARLPDCFPVTTLEKGVSSDFEGEVIYVDNPPHEQRLFQELLDEVDIALMIAPETDDVLLKRCRQVIDANIISWNCSPDAIELCGDKWLLHNHLQQHGLPTIPSRLCELSRTNHVSDSNSPFVLKPRDGAGSFLTFLIENRSDENRALTEIQSSGTSKQFILQPYIPGRALSIGLNIGAEGKIIDCLPIGEQRLSKDGRFRYLGGRIPAEIPESVRQEIYELAKTTSQTIPGLFGFIGIDLVLTENGKPVIVEMNPRLTTAYVGYRHLFVEAIPQRWRRTTNLVPLGLPRDEIIEFDPVKMLNSI